MTDLYIVVVEDRHTGVDALPFSTFAAAKDALEDAVHEMARHPERIERHLNDEPDEDGSYGYVKCSAEDDYVSIIRRRLDDDG